MIPEGLTQEITGDGSSTLRVANLGETYHSRHGAVTESAHVFIKAGLTHISKTISGRPIGIFEMGFGTGLNALLAEQWAANNEREVIFETVETMPLPQAVWERLIFPGITHERIQAIHEAPWEEATRCSTFFTLSKRNGSLLEIGLPDSFFDVVFFDAFAPSKQPELWTAAVMEKLHAALTPGGVLVTYCAQGQFKRNLHQAGFTVEALPGPPGKREMVRARRPLTSI